MASASTLRTVLRFLGSLALIIALARLCLAVVNHTALPLFAVIAAVIVCALVWMVPIGSGSGGGAVA